MEKRPVRTTLENVPESRLKNGIWASKAFLVLGVLFFSVWGMDGCRYAHVMKFFHKAPCTVLEPEGPEETWSYEYSVRGQSYRSRIRRIQDVLFNWDGFQEVTPEDQAMIGEAGVCFYDPKSPSVAVLFRSFPEPWVGCGFLVAMIELIAFINLRMSQREILRRLGLLDLQK